MTVSSAYREHRRKLWIERGGLCHWCGIKTVLPWLGSANLKRQPKRLATLDHLLSRWETLRCSRPRSVEGTVLSCLKCNQARAVEAKAEYTARTGKAELPSRQERRAMRAEPRPKPKQEALL